MPEWKDTVNLPRTGFPMKANLQTAEPEWLARWTAMDLYGQIRQRRAGRPRFVLHDGPPYANGNIHIGHALNKILKDLIVRSKTMAGFDAPYVPGWDCHGLPIELKVDRELGPKKREMSIADFRRACRDYASRYVDIQREEFERLGVIGREQVAGRQGDRQEGGQCERHPCGSLHQRSPDSARKGPHGGSTRARRGVLQPRR
jgi:isoleucyl-tRNA synthetase